MRARDFPVQLCLGLGAALLFGLAGCTDEEIVLVDRVVFNPPADEQNGFLGYFSVADKLTACGNCHTSTQFSWQTTAHAGAFETLENSGHAQDFCYGCHTVNESGNALSEAAGWNATQDSSYMDVQCESCHGPGLQHVEGPGAFQPLASLQADTAATNGCAECHSGTHHPFVEQWQESAHGSGPGFDRAATRDRCAPCHEGKTALEEKFLESSRYLEQDDGEPMRITCGVCHDPHGSPNDAQLRAPIDVATTDHLCVTCHSRRGTPPSSHGPHAAQGLLVLGENVGWIPAGFQLDTFRIASTHGTEANPKLCATCHVAQLEVTDSDGNFLLQSVGHLFEATTCLDADGIPTAGPCSVSERDFTACATSGCHGSDLAARSAYGVLVTRLNRLLDELWFDTDGDHVMDATDAGLLPQVVAQGDTSQINVEDDVVTVAEGALWNAMLAYTSDRTWWGDGEAFGIHFSAHKASGNGVHNPFFLDAVLNASIQAVIDEYGVTPSANFDGQVRSTVPPGVTFR